MPCHPTFVPEKKSSKSVYYGEPCPLGRKDISGRMELDRTNLRKSRRQEVASETSWLAAGRLSSGQLLHSGSKPGRAQVRVAQRHLEVRVTE